jgi:hypothetical protein
MPVDSLRIGWTDKLRHGLQTVAFCLTVSALQYAMQPSRPYALPLVYSLCIGPCTWALIDFGRHLFPSSAGTGWPAGLAGLLLPFAGIVGGYLMGTVLGDLWFGWSSWDTNPYARSQLPLSIVITGVAGIVGTFYFYSINKAKYLQSQMAEARHLATEAKLKLLETQLEPHMLFNTLANLRALVGSDPQRAQVMLDHLNNYLRATLNASRASLHPLQTEFDRLRDYLELMAIRMGPRLQFTLDLPPELASQTLPPLLLQPLVENSIKHGLEPKVEGGSINVTARRVGETLVLEVIDTGVGPGDAATGSTTGDAVGTTGSGFGMAQVRERLKTVYGAKATMSIGAGYACGTAVSITIPSKMAQT